MREGQWGSGAAGTGGRFGLALVVVVVASGAVFGEWVGLGWTERARLVAGGIACVVDGG